jgi:LuxR family maltose regulon positive regulatory protein
VRRLEAERDASLIVLVAPAGYGKTTLMARWMAATSRPAAWLTLHASDNDPVGFMGHVWAAFAQGDMIVPDERAGVHLTTRPATDGARRLIRALRSGGECGLLFLDNLDTVRSRATWDVISALIHQLQGEVQVVLASRSEPRVPIPDLRARGLLAELTTPDLAFDRDEAALLLQNAGVMPGYDLTQIMDRTEGWPVGLYLTTLALDAGVGGGPERVVRGDDLYIAEYLRHSVLDRLSEAKQLFLLRTSVLDRLSGPLCDAVLETTGSAKMLESLENSNLLIIRLDRHREWHRYHQMFQDLLQSELRLREPESVSGLHARAAEWFEAIGPPELAIHHAQAAGEPAQVARLIERVGRMTYVTGRSSTLFAWLDWLEEHMDSSGHAGSFALGALAAALTGDVLRGLRFLDRIPDDSHPLALLVRALRTESGVKAMIADARAARAGFPPGSEWIPACIVTEGLGWLFLGDEEQADALFAQAITQAGQLHAVAASTTALSQRTLIAIKDGRWVDADSHGTKALRQIVAHGLDSHSSSGLCFVLAARLARHQNDIPRARDMLARAATLRPQLNTALPTESVQTGIEMARAHIELADVAAAKVILRETRLILDECPDLGVLPAQWEQMSTSLSKMGPGTFGPSTLTAAELRLLPLLASHLTFPEIGERLYISRHTVKTQAMSIYRKLGASSRSEAVRAAEDAGLLGA